MHLSEMDKDGRQIGRELPMTVDPKPGDVAKITEGCFDLTMKGFSTYKVLD